jgi:Dyp-type peroxidase family
MYPLNRRLPKSPYDPATREMLADLQGNILKPHGRLFSRHLFLRFASTSAGLELVRDLAGRVTSAADQVQASRARRQYFAALQAAGASAPPREDVLISFLLTARGYARLGAEAYMPPDERFRRGMAAADLADPEPAEWERGLRGPIDALLLLAYGSRPADEQHFVILEQSYRRLIGRRATVLVSERGHVLSRRFGMFDRNVEHFGYVDGRSQPLLTEDDAEREARRHGDDRWDPAANLDRALVPCPGGAELGHGSYLVFRKLEQDVRGFAAATAAVREKLDPPSAARAGALIIGRYEEGTPLAVSGTPSGEWSNNFNYAGDPRGLECPLGGHVRKMNPRVRNEAERSHLFVRRGVPYDDRPREDRLRQPTPGQGGRHDPRRLPGSGAGLLFMCYNADISEQFEHVQREWANDPDYLGLNVGVDPVVGQGTGGRTYTWPVRWGGVETCPIPLERWVRMRGGEYFFAPSLSFLRRLGAGALRAPVSRAEEPPAAELAPA